MTDVHRLQQQKHVAVEQMTMKQVCYLGPDTMGGTWSTGYLNACHTIHTGPFCALLMCTTSELTL